MMSLQKNPSHSQQRSLILFLGAALTLVILTTIPLSFPPLNYSLNLLKTSLKPPNPSYNFITETETDQTTVNITATDHQQEQEQEEEEEEEEHEQYFCDLFRGEWIENPKSPYYTNESCWAIHEHQNCLKYGRPDTEFLRWRWKPDGCELPVFNPAQFLELMRDKSFAFVGDSIARNQVQSIICLLSRVEYPIDVSQTRDEFFKRWKYMSYNFTMAFLWTTHLVKSEESTTQTGLFNLHLDKFDEKWVNQIPEFDYLILSSGHWFLRPLIYYENNKITGCHDCFSNNITELGVYYGYRKAFRTAFKAILTSKNYRGITYMRTFSPTHFENGLWNQGGNCLRKRPFKSNETELDGQSLELYMTQMEEFRRGEREGKKKGLRFRLLDTTQAMWLRPDGHPSSYGHLKTNEGNVSLFNDCVHWCLPGPIDSWSDFLLQMLKMEGIRSAQEKLQFRGN